MLLLKTQQQRQTDKEAELNPTPVEHSLFPIVDLAVVFGATTACL